MEINDLEKDLERLLSAYREKTKGPKIRSLDTELNYLEARKAAEPYGGLPTNALHQKTLVETDDWKSPELKGYYPAFAREISVYPESGETMKKGEDVIDAFPDNKGRKWIYPAYCIPDEAINQVGKALMVNPRKIIEEEKEVTIIADPNKDVTILSDFPQCHSWTRTFGADNYVQRLAKAGVRPLVRGFDVFGFGGFVGGRRGVDVVYGLGLRFGVGYESPVEAPQNLLRKIWNRLQ
ncbi:hypothetical protein M1316_02610 [Candidatus Parvarchaeota archaeon]|jgi:hypothetical protein|nr:hypothetical protein [Candidatus Parvarchaeota archaeon]